jgi:hypothetical protein
MRSERNVFAAQANVTLAEALLRLAQDQRNYRHAQEWKRLERKQPLSALA